MKLTLPEELVLIAFDDQSGGGKARVGVDYAVAGLTLVELAVAGRVDVQEDDAVTVLDARPTGTAFVDAELAKIVEGDGASMGKLLRRAHRSALNGAVESLVARGVLKREKGRAFGVLPVTRFPQADAAPEREIRDRLSAAVLQGEEPDERTAALVAVLNGARLWGKAFPGQDRKQVKKRMDEISEGQWVGPVVRRAVRRTRAAILAASSGGGG
ncbi:GOLPH3/VPS74 family protein [Streptomyces sp. NBC_01304]|uniref:GOLPH3/VPS74 family protein n=1 Tax=Streptomyces sp. NBC_01304 TaxID=2903818 RepID=UPI002E12FDDD|nr:GPP34 family phosphoprotein [Streptomyces sp. NBC_01304]